MYYVMITFYHCTMYFAGENNDAIKFYIMYMYMYFELHFSSFFPNHMYRNYDFPYNSYDTI